jgi:hypothetical protein
MSPRICGFVICGIKKIDLSPLDQREYIGSGKRFIFDGLFDSKPPLPSAITASFFFLIPSSLCVTGTCMAGLPNISKLTEDGNKIRLHRKKVLDCFVSVSVESDIATEQYSSRN